MGHRGCEGHSGEVVVGAPAGYRDIAEANWQLFEAPLARGKGNKQARTKWLAEVNDLRKPVVHASKGQSLPITEEQVAFLDEIHRWLQSQLHEEFADTLIQGHEELREGRG